MRLTLKTPYKSILSLPTIDLPDFTIITGVNGAGKTHLLKAIASGSVAADIAPNPETDAKFFDWTSLVPNNTGEFRRDQLYQEREEIIDLARNMRMQQIDRLNAWIVKYGFSHQDREAIFHMDKDALESVIHDKSNIKDAYAELNGISTAIWGQMLRHWQGNPDNLARLQALRSRIGSAIVWPMPRDFADNPFAWPQVDLFRHSFAKLFFAYFELHNVNRLYRADKQEGRQPKETPLSEEEFQKKYNEPPWDFINRVLKEANLDFEIDHPTQYDSSRFLPKLTKTSNGVELQFSDLSSGEKILMSFALCLYQTLDTRQNVAFPKLLLFDEIDAPLHPSMSRQLVDTIRSALVERQQIKVILATHAPATVAVCAEEAIFVMHPAKPGLHKVGKRPAIAVLTSEIPTLAIDFSGQRQVFVESQMDARRYEKLYRFLSPKIPTERSLAFIGVGGKIDKKELNTGCDQVRRIVGQLVTHGNISVYGLIDWDTTNRSDGRVFVLAAERRYSIENCLLDPLLVAAISLYTDREKLASLVGAPPDIGYAALRNLSEVDCQAMIDAIERLILGLGDVESFGQRVAVDYLGGLTAKVSRVYLRKQGHELENAVKDCLPPLKRYHNSGQLMDKIIDQVIHDYPEFAPVELIDAFSSILQDAPDN